ncbi:uncharacterized protein LOC112171412 [Rosa chinensis]|uniref:uncharacterized protein LOC112171412 n=1 Tax=Rosa chinensis TaxID=74649 RepID=UPI000D094CFF|nr:uncharacterized protein LOC112171412 [Rosa chinensis]
MAQYSGLTDPFIHMDTFKKVTNNKGFDDATLCHLFSETLGHHNISQLFSVKQGIEETLKAFVTRWRAAASRCHDLDKTMTLAAFKQGLLKGLFLYHLNYNYPNTAYDHVMREVVIHAQCKDQIPPPPPRKYPRVCKSRNTSKWCKYNEDSCHNTNSCNALKTAIETLYRNGKLEQFKVRQPPPVVANIEPIRRINTIDGGAPIGNMSHRARNRYARANHPKEVCNIRYERSAKLPRSGWEPITFSEEEECGVHLPHDHPFLIDAILDKWSVGRVLVDSGSAINVIFNGYYNQL